MTTKIDVLRSLVEHYEHQYVGLLQGLVRDIHRLADRIEREGIPSGPPEPDGTPPFTTAAREVGHAVARGLANMHTPDIPKVAAMADLARVKLEAAEALADVERQVPTHKFEAGHRTLEDMEG